jgi:hypothetical protein
MAEKTVQVSNPKGLTEDEFESLFGTYLHISMVKSRCVINLKGSDPARAKLHRQIEAWLFDNCKGLYHLVIADIDPIRVFFEREADMVNFKITFEGQDTSQLEPPPPKPKRVPRPKPAPTPAPNSHPEDWCGDSTDEDWLKRIERERWERKMKERRKLTTIRF